MKLESLKRAESPEAAVSVRSRQLLQHLLLDLLATIFVVVAANWKQHSGERGWPAIGTESIARDAKVDTGEWRWEREEISVNQSW